MSDQNPAKLSDERATGTRDPVLQARLIDQSLEVINDQSPNGSEARQAVLASLTALAPTDYLEGVLASQVTAVNECAMECLRRASQLNAKTAVRDIELRHAEKLLNLHTRLLEFYEKRRRSIAFGGFPPKLPLLRR